MLKSTFSTYMGYNIVADIMGHSLSCCCLPNLRNPKKFSENSNLLQFISRSSKVIDLGASRKRMCNFLLAINSNFGRISYIFRLTFKARKWPVFHPSLV